MSFLRYLGNSSSKVRHFSVMLLLSLPQWVSLQDLLSKLGRPFREYELWALCLACLRALQMHAKHPGDVSHLPYNLPA